jgi:hypothetical protein
MINHPLFWLAMIVLTQSMFNLYLWWELRRLERRTREIWREMQGTTSSWKGKE